MFSQRVIWLLLELEGAAMAVSGQPPTPMSLRLPPVASATTEVTNNDDDAAAAAATITNEEEETLQEPLSGTTTPQERTRSSFFGTTIWRLEVAVGVAVAAGLLASYYLIHFRLTPPSERQGKMTTSLLLEFPLFLLALSFPFCAPLHAALGYHAMCDSDAVGQRRAQRTTQLLQQDPTTSQLTYLFLWLVVQYTAGEVTFFWELFPISTALKCLYALGAVVKIGLIYGALLWALVVARVVLTRLDVIEKQADWVLSQQLRRGRSHDSPEQNSIPITMLYNDYATFAENPDMESLDFQRLDHPDATIAQWTEEWKRGYESIRHDFHQTCHRFGTRMLLVAFLFLVDTTSMILTFYEQLEENLTAFAVTCLLVSYTANSIVISTTLSNYAYIQTKSQIHIGSKLNLISMSEQPQQHDTTTPVVRIDRLATGFMLAPVRFHLGNFELGPEYANATAVWFVGLFLYVFGLKAPGVE